MSFVVQETHPLHLGLARRLDGAPISRPAQAVIRSSAKLICVWGTSRSIISPRTTQPHRGSPSIDGGKVIQPQRELPVLHQTDVLVVGGENRTFVSALVNIDIENMGRYAEANHIAYTTFTDLSQKPEVIDIVKREILNINKTLPDHARIKRFVNLHKEFDADEAELTRTRKIRRAFVEERYKNIIEEMYGDRKEIAVESEVTYQDGRKGILRAFVKVRDLESRG